MQLPAPVPSGFITDNMTAVDGWLSDDIR